MTICGCGALTTSTLANLVRSMSAPLDHVHLDTSPAVELDLA